MTRQILVLGATGGIGGEFALAALKRGWKVRALTRRPEEAAQKNRRLAGLEWIAGDAMSATDLRRAARGCDVIFHGAHPANYRHWAEWGVPMLANSIAAATENGARLVLPGNIYNYGPDAGAFVAETAAQHPLTEKGAIRVRMEEMLRDATRDGRMRALVVRANDFFGPHSPSSWFSAGMVKAGKPLRSVTYPGRPEVGHGFAYLPDLAEATARLIEAEEKLAPFDTVHFGGHWFERGIEFAHAVGRAAGNPELPIRRFPWFAVALAYPIVPMLRELWKMRYLWREPLQLDNSKLVSLIGAEPHTPIDTALRETLAGLGCLPAGEPVATRLAVA